MIEIQENAIFIADSHYPHHGDDFLKLLQRLDNKEIETSQLFLMGDNFDLLFGYNDYIQTYAKEAITLLQTLSEQIEIHYFEGNHDFCLDNILPFSPHKLLLCRRLRQVQVFRQFFQSNLSTFTNKDEAVQQMCKKMEKISSK